MIAYEGLRDTGVSALATYTAGPTGVTRSTIGVPLDFMKGNFDAPFGIDALDPSILP